MIYFNFNFILIFYLFLIIINTAHNLNKENEDVDNQENEKLYQYKPVQISESEDVFFYESFDNFYEFKKNWIKSEASNKESQFKYSGLWDIVRTNSKLRGDYGLRLKSKARHNAISCKLNKVFLFNGSNLIVQYDIQFRNGQECGGGYIKLLTSPSGNLSLIDEKSPYTIMFGPDKCSDDQKIHFIFNHVNSQNESRELHWKNAQMIKNLNEIFLDSKWHLFRLTLRPDNSFEIMMDKIVVGKGNLLKDFDPPVNPVNSVKNQMLKNEQISNNRVKDKSHLKTFKDEQVNIWDEEIDKKDDGHTVKKNKIEIESSLNNIQDVHPYKMKAFDAVAFELWSITDAVIFDNILVTKNVDIANLIADTTYQLKRDINDKMIDTWFKTFIKNTNKRPWLWGVYVILTVLPVIFLFSFCFTSSTTDKNDLYLNQNSDYFEHNFYNQGDLDDNDPFQNKFNSFASNEARELLASFKKKKKNLERDDLFEFCKNTRENLKFTCFDESLEDETQEDLKVEYGSELKNDLESNLKNNLEDNFEYSFEDKYKNEYQNKFKNEQKHVLKDEINENEICLDKLDKRFEEMIEQVEEIEDVIEY